MNVIVRGLEVGKDLLKEAATQFFAEKLQAKVLRIVSVRIRLDWEETAIEMKDLYL